MAEIARLRNEKVGAAELAKVKRQIEVDLLSGMETANEVAARELFSKEDWWAIWLGCGLIAAAILLFANGGSIKWLAVAPQKWSHLPDVLTLREASSLPWSSKNL